MTTASDHDMIDIRCIKQSGVMRFELGQGELAPELRIFNGESILAELRLAINSQIGGRVAGFGVMIDLGDGETAVLNAFRAEDGTLGLRTDCPRNGICADVRDDGKFEPVRFNGTIMNVMRMSAQDVKIMNFAKAA